MEQALQRLNKYIASRTMLSRRGADLAIAGCRVTIDGIVATAGTIVRGGEVVLLDGKPLATTPATRQTILLHKPAGYVVSRDGQGSKTIYDLLPAALHHLNPIGRLDKDSSGLLLLTNDGNLAEELTHPKYQKQKIYEVTLDKDLAPLHRQMIAEFGVQLEDGPSTFGIARLTDDDRQWQIIMHEGRNRQIRRTFASLGYTVTELRRTQFGAYILPQTLHRGSYLDVTSKS